MATAAKGQNLSSSFASCPSCNSAILLVTKDDGDVQTSIDILDYEWVIPISEKEQRLKIIGESKCQADTPCFVLPEIGVHYVLEHTMQLVWIRLIARAKTQAVWLDV